jgi:hypothetical protein
VLQPSLGSERFLDFVSTTPVRSRWVPRWRSVGVFAGTREIEEAAALTMQRLQHGCVLWCHLESQHPWTRLVLEGEGLLDLGDQLMPWPSEVCHWRAKCTEGCHIQKHTAGTVTTHARRSLAAARRGARAGARRRRATPSFPQPRRFSLRRA